MRVFFCLLTFVENLLQLRVLSSIRLGKMIYKIVYARFKDGQSNRLKSGDLQEAILEVEQHNKNYPFLTGHLACDVPGSVYGWVNDIELGGHRDVYSRKSAIRVLRKENKI